MKNGKVAKSILLPHKTYPFQNGQRIIDYQETGECYLRTFLQTGYAEYDSLDRELGIGLVIEYYISAIGQKNIQEEFLLGAIAFDSLSSHVKEFAERNGDKLESGSIQTTRSKVQSWRERNRLDVSDSQIDELTSSIAYKGVGIKDSLKYLFDKKGITYTSNELDFVAVRGEVVHTGTYRNIPALIRKNSEMFNLLDRTILTLLGWKGKKYLNKLDGYRQATL